MNSIIMILCGNVDLLRICRDNIMINELSNREHMKGGRVRA